ncbi:MAG TPA: hypothetical protein VM369_01580 [Candidatus Binatia bacterium]|nr:hypothetical protein [Candidatus Binatia bacterium]
MSFARRLLLSCCLAAAPALAAGAQPLRLGAELGAGYDSNLGNAGHAQDVRDSPFGAAALQAEWTQDAGAYAALALRARADGESYARLHTLDNLKGSLQLRGLLRPGGGFFVPTLSAWGSAARWEFNSAMRDGYEYRAGAALLEQVTTAIRLRLNAGWSRRDSESRVFDLHGGSVGAALDWSLAPRVSVFGGWQWYRGDVVSTGKASYPSVSSSQAVEADDAFGGFGAGQFAYRLRGHAQLATAGFNVALARNLSLDVQQLYADSRAGADEHYVRSTCSASLLLRF